LAIINNANSILARFICAGGYSKNLYRVQDTAGRNNGINFAQLIIIRIYVATW